MTWTRKTSTVNYALDQEYDNKFPSGSTITIRTGAPAGPDNAAGGSALIAYTTGAGWNAAASKSKSKNFTLSGAATAGGTAGHVRMSNAADTERAEGTITATGGGGDMTVDNTNIASGQTVTVTTLTISGT